VLFSRGKDKSRRNDRTRINDKVRADYLLISSRLVALTHKISLLREGIWKTSRRSAWNCRDPAHFSAQISITPPILGAIAIRPRVRAAVKATRGCVAIGSPLSSPRQGETGADTTMTGYPRARVRSTCCRPRASHRDGFRSPLAVAPRHEATWKSSLRNRTCARANRDALPRGERASKPAERVLASPRALRISPRLSSSLLVSCARQHANRPSWKGWKGRLDIL